MTLRLRLVLAVFVLVAAGLGLFGVTTYSLYARSQYRQLDDQIRTSAPFVAGELTGNSSDSDRGQPSSEGGPSRGGGDGGHGPGGPLSSYGELRSKTGAVLATSQRSTTNTPKLPASVTLEGERSRYFTTAAATGSGQWRVYVTSAPGSSGNVVLVAVPLGDVASSLRRLVSIEVGGGVGLLALLSAGTWLVLRRGLRPLEQMAGTAGAIAAGDLSQRVEPSGSAGEVAQLGVAFNTMLDEIEAAFAERDATEHRLRQFLADASHELRTPLTSIQGFAELFRIGGDREHADLPTILRRIEDESARMRVLVDDLLLLARLDQTRPFDSSQVDLAVLAADACSDAVAAAPDRPVTLDAPEPVIVAGDVADLRQAVGNLVANAVRHTPPGTPITVVARLEDGAAVVAVRDHGPGLDEETLAHAFDRFWQADRARVGAGSGLGLSIVAGVAAEHGGRVTASNTPEGGAVFTITLPVSH
jgi:two-component system OmpR family sensor kinase